MVVATGSQSDLGYVREVVYGTTPENVSLKRIRHIKTSLGVSKDTYSSEEKRTDRMTADIRHGIVKVSGDVETELSVTSYDDFLEALMGGTWTEGLEVTEAELGTLACTGSTGIFQTTSGDLIALGLKKGDIINLNTDGGANEGDFTITDVTEFTFTVDEEVEDILSALSTFTLKVLGKKLGIGNEYRSFSIERAFRDIGKYQVNTGCMVNSISLSVPPTGIAKTTYNFIGRNQLPTSDTTINDGDSYTQTSESTPLISVKGELRENGVKMATVTGLSFSIDNGIAGQPTLGSNFIQHNLWGNSQKVTGELTVLFEDEIMYNKFVNETESSVEIKMDEGLDFMKIRLPRIKYTSGDIGDAEASGLPVNMSFEALAPNNELDDKSVVSFQEYVAIV